MKISIETIINAPLDIVWSSWITPADITNWNFAAVEWCCPKAEIDLVIDGQFSYRMEAKDGSMGFAFEGVFTSIVEKSEIEYVLEDGRKVLIMFSETKDGIKLLETFDAEDEQSAEQQKQGWQSILNNFKEYVENKCN